MAQETFPTFAHKGQNIISGVVIDAPATCTPGYCRQDRLVVAVYSRKNQKNILLMKRSK